MNKRLNFPSHHRLFYGQIAQVNKPLSESKECKDDVLYPIVAERVKVDLDDGVKVNYGMFGDALMEVVGLWEAVKYTHG